MDLLIIEIGIEIEKSPKEVEEKTGDDQLFKEVTFDQCVNIYRGPEKLEVTSLCLELDLFKCVSNNMIVLLKMLNYDGSQELEALSIHYALLFNQKQTNKQNYHLSKSLFMMKSLNMSRKFLV